MPILPAEPDMYPPNLWEDDEKPDPECRWWCLHTKPRQEKATARLLRDRRISHYLPQAIHEGRTPNGRKTRSVLPLFTSYLFLRGSEYQRADALKGNTLVGILEVPDQDVLQRDLRQIHQLLSSGLPVTPEPIHPVGARVRIVTGPLQGMAGMVVRRDQRNSFVALVHFLGRGASVQLEDWQVERIEESSTTP